MHNPDLLPSEVLLAGSSPHFFFLLLPSSFFFLSSSLFFLAVLGVEFRALRFQGKCSTI
jgi:hypothetical protein